MSACCGGRGAAGASRTAGAEHRARARGMRRGFERDRSAATAAVAAAAGA